ncbi:major facilitator superfamily domain-containing protein [Kockiozyma suomiensis]|uniref:major facilitator superfamily domain-containing protein n=1 Tax=Kockiozyma suomiensis TaxID=1337062 RepID=UPI0033436409
MAASKFDEQHIERVGTQLELQQMDSFATVDAPDIKVDAGAHAGIDEELRKFVAAGENVEVDEATSTRLRRMIDKRILVVMLGTYFLQSLDKNALNFTAIMGIKEDAHLVGQDYSWLHTVIYFGVLAAEYPTVIFVQKVPIAKYLAVNVFLWGVVIAMTCFGHNFASLVALRVLLGLFEAVSQPTFLLLSSMWYKREEQATIVACWYGMNGIQGLCGGLIAYGISHINSSVLKSWQVLYIILGCITCTWAVFILWWMPDSPMRAKCFSEEDRVLMIERVRANQTGVQNRKLKKSHIIEAIKDFQIWCYVFIEIIIQIPSGGLGSFSTLIIKGFGYTTLQTELLSMVNGGCQVVAMLGAAYLLRRFQRAVLLMMLFLVPNIVGTIVLLTVPVSKSTRVGLLFAYWITISFWGMMVILMSTLARNVAGQTKKSVSTASLFLAWAVGNMIGPQVFKSNQAPRYFTGFAVHMGCYAVIIILLCALGWYLRKENRRRDALQEVDWRASEANLDNAFDDLTDKENLSFRYMY